MNRFLETNYKSPTENTDKNVKYHKPITFKTFTVNIG